MLNIEPIEITKNELKRLLLAAVLMPPICTLAGALAMAPPTRPFEAPVATHDGGELVRAVEPVPTLEFAPPAITPTDPLTLMPAPTIPFELALAPLPEPAVAVEPIAETPAAETPAAETPVAAQAVSASDESATIAEVAAAIEQAATAPPAAGEAAPAKTSFSKAPSSANGHFVVQAGMFSREANARRCREDLLHRGISSAVVQHAGARGTTYHVVLARFDSWREAERARKQLTAELHIELFATRLPMRSVTEQIAAI